jgi:hypothetical protein
MLITKKLFYILVLKNIGYSSDTDRIQIGYSSDTHRIQIGYRSDTHIQIHNKFLVIDHIAYSNKKIEILFNHRLGYKLLTIINFIAQNCF